MDEEDVGAPVQLYVYDLTKGMAAMMSQALLGTHIEGIWHTAVVAYGREYFFGSSGVQSCNPGGTVLGQPTRIVELGDTFIPYPVFLDYLFGLGETNFRPTSYHLFKHNCNNFSDEVSQFLCGTGIPKYVLSLPEEILNTPLGQTLRPLVDSLSQGARGISSGNGARAESPEFLQLNSAIEEARRTSVALEERRSVLSEKLARKERKKERKERRRRHKEGDTSGSGSELTPDGDGEGEGARGMADGEPSPEGVAGDPEAPGAGRRAADVVSEMEEEDRREQEEERKKKQREPPIVFKDAVDVRVEFDALVGLIDGVLSSEEQRSLEELHQYMLEDEGSWALGDGFLNFVGRLLHDKSLQPEVRVRVLNVLALAALKDDVILLLHQDRREHVLMNYAHDVDRVTPEEQEALALFICNLFENLSSSEWLLYISEWQYCNASVSNIRVTTKVAVNALLSGGDRLRDYGTAIVHNLACKEKMTQNKTLRGLLPKGSFSKVFDDVAVELTMAVLQFFNGSPSEEHLFRCLKALLRFCLISPQDVPQLVQMVGPAPAKFRGTSPRVDELVEAVCAKLR
ncbi:uncharacterized protein LOC134541218 isoform X2 [Bacillus rossius redtenbacheri]